MERTLRRLRDPLIVSATNLLLELRVKRVTLQVLLSKLQSLICMEMPVRLRGGEAAREISARRTETMKRHPGACFVATFPKTDHRFGKAGCQRADTTLARSTQSSAVGGFIQGGVQKKPQRKYERGFGSTALEFCAMLGWSLLLPFRTFDLFCARVLVHF